MRYLFAFIIFLLPSAAWASAPVTATSLPLESDFFKCNLKSHEAIIWFDSKGELSCKNVDVSTIPQKASLRVGIVVPKGTAHKYVLRLKPGDTKLTGSIRGLEHLSKVALDVKTADENKCANWFKIELEPGEMDQDKKTIKDCKFEWRYLDTFEDGFSTTDFALSITTPAPASVSTTTAFDVEQGYYVNVGLLGTIGLYRDEEYEVSNKRIRKEFTDNPLNFYGGVHIYVGSALQCRPRYFNNRSLVNELDKVSFYLGVDLSDPRDGIAAGIGYDVFQGANIVAVWQPHRVKTLDGLHTGSSFEGENLPTNDRWTGKISNVGIGISIDTSIIDVFDKE